MGKNSPGKVDEETKFFKYMYALRQDIDWVYEIVKLLEGVSIDNQSDQSRDFGISYVIKFLEKYCRSKDDYEFLLAAYGFLEGFTYIDYESCDKRATVYWQYACKYKTHEFIKTRWGIQSVPNSLRKRHKKILGYLNKISDEIKAKNDGKLGLIEKVPKKLEFPKPRKIENTIDTLKNGVSYINPNNESKSHQPNAAHNTELKNEALKNPSPQPLEPGINQINKNSIEQEESEQKIPDTNSISICEEDEQDVSTKDSDIQVSTNANNREHNLQETFFIGLFPDESPEPSMSPNKLSVIKKSLKNILGVIVYTIFVVKITIIIFTEIQQKNQPDKTRRQLEFENMDRQLSSEFCINGRTEMTRSYWNDETGQTETISLFVGEEVNGGTIDAENN